MSEYRVHTVDSAPAEARELLETFKKRYSFVPNLIGLLASSPAAVASYDGVYDALSKGRLAAAEGQLVAIAVSVANGCEYCVAAHSAVAKMMGLPADALVAAREARPIADVRLEALRRFATRVVEARGRVSTPDQEAFFAAGFDAGHALELLAWVALKTLSNYANHLAHTPIDPAFAQFAWTNPSP